MHKGLNALIFALSGMLSMPALSADKAPDPALRASLVQAIDNTDGFKDRFEAEVWMVDMSTRLEKFVKDPERRLKMLRIIHREATRTIIPPELVLAVIEVESHFDPFAVSSAGARGLMQIMPFWLDEIGNLASYKRLVADGRLGKNLFEMETNIWFGCSILKYYMDIEKGNIGRALARYNGSLGRAKYPHLVSRALTRHWRKQ